MQIRAGAEMIPPGSASPPPREVGQIFDVAGQEIFVDSRRMGD